MAILAGTFLGLAAGRALPSFAAPPPTAQQILSRTADNYRGVARYAFEGVLRTDMTYQGQYQNISVDVRGAFERPGKYRLMLESQAGSSAFVSDGDSVTTYSGQLGQYSRSPWVAPNPGGRHSLPGFDPGGGHPFSGYERMDENLVSASVERMDTLEVGGRQAPAWVVSVAYDPASIGSDSLTTIQGKTFWIDARTGHVLRDAVVIQRHSPGVADTLTMRQSADYKVTSWDEPLPDTTFAFRPPAGSVPVAQIGAGGAVAAAGDGKWSGKAAVDFTLPDLAGKSHKLSAQKGKVVLVNFWATWCGPCRREMPEIQKLYDEFKGKGLSVYGVNCSESTAKAKNYVTNNKYTFPILLDTSGAVQEQYGVEGIPTVLIVDRAGTVSAHYVGAQSGATLRAGLKKAGLE
ncbi:MAG: redoxin domain-containing protein [Candidatus Eiseniibacteriota bacterium]